jgi:hypothetical protein
VARSNDAHIYVHVGQKLAVKVIDLSRDLAHRPSAYRANGSGYAGQLAFPRPSGDRIPSDLHFLSHAKAANLRLVHKSTDLHVLQICYLYQHLTAVYVCTGPYWKCINGPRKGRSYVQVLQQLLCCTVSSACLRDIGLHLLHLWR